jgi:hypothetical protein
MMTRLWLALPMSLLLLSAGPALGQEQAQSPGQKPGQDRYDVENTSILWLKPGNSMESVGAELTRRGIKPVKPADSGVLVEGDAAELQRLLDEDPSFSELIEYVEPNGVVRLFPSECVEMEAPAAELVPPGVRRVRGPIELGEGIERRVWVVDSGIAVEYDATAGGELNVDRELAAECTFNGCAPGTADDSFGHGTAVASIIAATENGNGLVGVAPGARLVPIRVFQSEEADWASIYPAMSYLMMHAAPGDVVNVSFGGSWDPSATGQPRMIERQLRQLADKGIRVAIAAGNLDALPNSAYVQTVSPARAGAYRAQQGGGAVLTVSAMDDSDAFWPESGFGNGERSGSSALHIGPPDLAEPGVMVPVLWPGGEMRSCTGTSFAAPHLAGILLQGLPEHDGQVKGDIDAVMQSETGLTEDPPRGDPIGVCLRDHDGTCRAR